MPACLRSSLSCLVLTTFSVVGLGVPEAAVAGTVSRHRFVNDTNEARLHHDRRLYAVSSQLTEVAQNWAQWMARHHTLKHNPNLETQVHHWQALGENVGSGDSEPPIHRAFMDDPYHRDNILSRTYTQMGIGTARDDNGRLYVDEVFRRPVSS